MDILGCSPDKPGTRSNDLSLSLFLPFSFLFSLSISRMFSSPVWSGLVVCDQHPTRPVGPNSAHSPVSCRCSFAETFVFLFKRNIFLWTCVSDEASLYCGSIRLKWICLFVLLIQRKNGRCFCYACKLSVGSVAIVWVCVVTAFQGSMNGISF